MNEVRRSRSRIVPLAGGLFLLLLATAVTVVGLRAGRAPVQSASTAAAPRPDETGADLRAEFMFPEGAAAGVLEGRVLDERGTPVVGALVSIAPRLVGTKGYRSWSKQNALT